MTEAAAPILASTLWSAQQQKFKSKSSDEPRKVKTDLVQLDPVLRGGFDYGAVVSISSDADAALGELLNSILVSNLVNSSHTNVTIIISVLGNRFDLAKLHKYLLQSVSDRSPDADAETANQATLDALGRVRIIKALDFIGLIEGLAELRAVLEETYAKDDQLKIKPPFKSTISDSEDEEDLTLSPSNRKDPSAGAKSPISDNILIIDSLSTLQDAVIKNSPVQGRALFESTLRSVTNLTRTYDLCTILISDTTSMSSKSETSPSIFVSCTTGPSPGNDVEQFSDLSLLLHRIPVTADAAFAAYGTQAGTNSIATRFGTVIEVTLDRHGSRKESWSAIEIDPQGRIIEL